VNAKKAAAHAAEAALLLTAGAEGDRARAEQAVGAAEDRRDDGAHAVRRGFEEALSKDPT
jgi:hypothetical protein